MRLLAVLLLVGCHTSYVRYVGTAASPDEARMVVATRAHAVGWKREKRRPASSLIELGEVAHPETLRDDPVPAVGSRADSSRPDMRADGSSPVDTRVAIADTTPPDRNQADVPSRPDLSPDGVDVYRTFDGKPTVTARAMPFGSGSLLEVSSKSVAMIDRVSSGGDTYEAKDQKWSLDVFHVDTTIDVGYARSMHTDFQGRADWMVHLGHALWTRGGDAAVVETRKRISLVGGVGLTVTDRPAFRPEVGVMFDMQDALKPFGDRIYQSRRKSLSFSVAIPRGPEYTALEGGVTIHVPPYGGVFARAGYEWADGKRGPAYMVGARLDTVPTVVAVMAVAMYGLVVAAKEKDWSIDCLRECQDQ